MGPQGKMRIIKKWEEMATKLNAIDSQGSTCMVEAVPVWLRKAQFPLPRYARKSGLQHFILDFHAISSSL